MRSFTSLTIALISAFATSLTAQTVSTVPAGFNTITVRQFKITSNTTDTLTLQTNGVDLTTATANGDSYEVLPIHTLGTFFGAAADPNKPAINRNGDPNLADNVLWRGAFG